MNNNVFTIMLYLLVLIVPACGAGGGGTAGTTSGGTDTTPPEISNAQPSGQQPAGTTSVTMQVTTNENATCRYAPTDVVYSSMTTTFSTTGSVSHSTTISGLSNGNSYTRYVRCRDSRGNVNVSSTAVNWNVGTVTDITPPVVSNPLPSGVQAAGTTSVTMQVTTNENATCRYSTTSGTAYGSMTNTFTTTGGTAHSSSVLGLSNGQTYNRYVRCSDASGNANTSDTTVTWSVASATGSATLTWGPSSPIDATHGAPDVYRVYRCSIAGTSGTCSNFSLLDTVSSTVCTPSSLTCTYTSSGLSSGNTYCYQVTAYNTAGESSPADCSSGNNCCKSIQ